ncbi:MAG: sigma-54-dependent Fis family transcriptional regulator [Planctomycetes bacterium]|nr:sigma-54-dependent Fis family transcriptional regulator [Planctomycetota bacterium]
MPLVLVVEDNASMREVIRLSLVEHGHTAVEAASGEEAVKRLADSDFDLVISDLRLPGDLSGLDVLRKSKEAAPDAEVLLITAHGTIAEAVEAMRLGALDFLTKPFSIEELEARVEKALSQARAAREARELREALRDEWGRLVGVSPAIAEVRRFIDKVADVSTPVLITGESGAGKEVVARHVHERSHRRKKPFIAVNCAALPAALLESELFGHEMGAFTGAVARRLGRFELAHEGTLFLDEIGEIPPSLQIKLLRVLQETAFERVGGQETIRADVRVICATNRDLKSAIAAGRFREDLLYRINVLALHLPALRDRREDIPPLVEHFLDRYNMRLHKNVVCPAATLACLLAHAWPGNVRELENVIERGVVLSTDGQFHAADLPPEVRCGAPGEATPSAAGGSRAGDGSAGATASEGRGASVTSQVRGVERELLRHALLKHGWNQSRAARELGLGRTSLQYKMKKYGLTPEPGAG